MAYQVRQAAIRADADTVHDLRVSIRRLRECLRTFAGLYPAAPRKKVRKELRKLMKCAEQVRSADIAIALLGSAGLTETDTLIREIHAQRAAHHTQLRDELTALGGRPYTRSWREVLGL